MLKDLHETIFEIFLKKTNLNFFLKIDYGKNFFL